jgi:hypothetical protein
MYREEGAVGPGCLVLAPFPLWALWRRDELRGGGKGWVVHKDGGETTLCACSTDIHFTDEENEITYPEEHI